MCWMMLYPLVFLSALLLLVSGRVVPCPLHLSSIIESCYKLNRTTTTIPGWWERGIMVAITTPWRLGHLYWDTEIHSDAGIWRGLYSIKYSRVWTLIVITCQVAACSRRRCWGGVHSKQTKLNSEYSSKVWMMNKHNEILSLSPPRPT